MTTVEHATELENLSPGDRLQLCNKRISELVDELTDIYIREHREDKKVYRELRQATDERNILLSQLTD